MIQPRSNGPGAPPFLVRVQKKNLEPKPDDWGSGLLVATDWVLTAGHVIEAAKAH